MTIDVEFDHRLDSMGKDPDNNSPYLKFQHQKVWTKPLPNGVIFDIHPEPRRYLAHVSELGEFHLSSDAIANSLRHQRSMRWLIEQIPEPELDEFQARINVLGARIIFPGNRVGGRATINAARGFSTKINDRFDLTLECIRLHYLGKSSPLQETLARFADFFELFSSFKGYVEFFLLHDLVTEDMSQVNFFLPHKEFFESSPRPESVDAYLLYKENTLNFVRARNSRIQNWVDRNLS